MHSGKAFGIGTLAVAAFAALTLAGCGGSKGTYKLDKAEVKKAIEAELATKPATQQGMAKVILGMIDASDVTLELQGGGTFKLTITAPSLEKDKPPKTEVKEGTWKQSGDTITVTPDDGKPPSTCTKSGPKLTCSDGSKGGMMMIFAKT